jgi:diaminopimelate epimerase
VAHALGLVDKKIGVSVDGGSLLIKIEGENEITMEGPAADICRGIFFFEK